MSQHPAPTLREGDQVEGQTASEAVEPIRSLLTRLRLPGSAVSILTGILIWELGLRALEISRFALVPPSEVVQEFLSVVMDGTLWPHLQISLVGFLAGFAVCVAIAVPLGLLTGASPTARTYLDPWITAAYATPMIALAPLLIISLGFGLAPKVAVVAFACFFPVVINTSSGVRSVDADLLDVGTAFQATRLEFFRKIILPAAMPYIFAGMRLAVGRGIVGLVVADLFGARRGLGLMLIQSAQLFNTARIFVVAVVLALLGVAFTALIQAAENHTLRWRA